MICTPPDVIGMVDSERMRWVGHVVLTVKIDADRFWWGKTEGKTSLG